MEIRALLAAYFASKAMDETDRLWANAAIERGAEVEVIRHRQAA